MFWWLMLFLVGVAFGQRRVNQACILANGSSGRCIRIGECSKIVELTTRNVLYSWETQQIRAVLRACESDESSSDPIVCVLPKGDERRISDVMCNVSDHFRFVVNPRNQRQQDVH